MESTSTPRCSVSSNPAPTNQESTSTKMSPIERLQSLAEDYLASQPGPDNTGPNVALHSGLRRALKGRILPEDKVQVIRLTEIVVYRLAAMHEADYLRMQAGINYPSIFTIDANLLLVQKGATDQHLRSKTRNMLLAKNITTIPDDLKRQWGKPLHYLTLALLETSSSWEAIKDRIDVMAANNASWLQFVSRAWHGQRCPSSGGE